MVSFSPADLPFSDCLFNGAVVAIIVFLIISTMIMPNGLLFFPIYLLELLLSLMNYDLL